MAGRSETRATDRRRPRLWSAVALLAAALVLRAPQFGQVDQLGTELDAHFYLLVGDRMLHGAWPVLDIWDRKPPGLFLIYAFARLFGGTVLPYQLLATAAAWVGAVLVWRIAARTAADGVGVAAGVAYLAWLMLLGGDGGQSPVFYNPLIAGAALLAMRAHDRDDPRRVARLSVAASALCGLALQIKYTALPEALAISGWCLWRLVLLRAGLRSLAGTALAMLAAGLAPTLLVLAAYAAHGGLAAFWYADFRSIFDRAPAPADMVRANGLRLLVQLLLPVLIAGVALATVRTRDRALLLLWIASAAIGVAMLGGFYAHYALPLVTPLVVAAAALFGRGAIGVVSAGLLILPPLQQARWPALQRQGTVAALTAAIRPYVDRDHCLFVYDGSPLLYLTTAGCLPSRIASPDHFANAVEAPALGIDIAAETARVLAAKPGAIVTSDGFVIPLVNVATYRMVAATLARDYVRVAAVPGAGRTFFVDVRRDRPHPPSVPPAAMAAHLPRHTLDAGRAGANGN